MQTNLKSKNLNIALIMAAFMLLTACSSNSGPIIKSGGYASARAQATLEIPPDLINTTSDDVKRSVEGLNSVQILPDIQGLKIQGEGLQRYLRVEADAEQTWAKLFDFTNAQNLPILTENKRDGILETDWIGDDTAVASIGSKLSQLLSGNFGRPPVNDKYTFWLERLEQNTTAVHVKHSKLLQKVVEPKGRKVGTTLVHWEESPGEEFKVVTILRDMKSFFTGEKAHKPSNPVQLFTEGPEYITVTQPFEQVWALVGKALPGTQYRIVGLDREKNLYLIKPLKKKGLLAKMTYNRKLGVKVESISDTSSRITVTTSRGRGIDREDALPVLYALTGELRK